MSSPQKKFFSPIVRIIIVFGLISMFGDMVYEAARSVNSQYLNILEITATQVGLVFGAGEFLGYFLRLVAGIISDKSGRYWIFVFVGYGMLLVVPLIGFTMEWNILLILILMERIGKALRSPAKDTILSGVAENQVGIGFAFGLQESLDQLGAFIGPLIFTAVFYLSSKSGIAQYQLGYRMLFIPFVLLMFFLSFAYRNIKKEKIHPGAERKNLHQEHVKSIFWMYTAFVFFSTLGFVNFSIAGYHLKANSLLSDGNITLIYSAAMAVDAVAALVVGKFYDRLKARSGRRTGGLVALISIPLLTLGMPALLLSSSVAPIIVGMAIFGVVMGTHETIMRSSIADIMPFNKRGTSYGIFNTSYGLALFGGAALMGLLYDRNLIGLIIAFSCLMELVALFIYFKIKNMVH